MNHDNRLAASTTTCEKEVATFASSIVAQYQISISQKFCYVSINPFENGIICPPAGQGACFGPLLRFAVPQSGYLPDHIV
jgi:hypothetical protein